MRHNRKQRRQQRRREAREFVRLHPLHRMELHPEEFRRLMSGGGR